MKREIKISAEDATAVANFLLDYIQDYGTFEEQDACQRVLDALSVADRIVIVPADRMEAA